MPDANPTSTSPAATPAATGASGGQGADDLLSSRELKEAGIDTTNWKAKYDGLVGSARNTIAKLQEQLSAKDLEISTRDQQIATLQAEVAELQGTVDGAKDLQTKLDAATAESQQAKDATARQAVLLKFPALLVPTKDGQPNPVIDLLMNANLPLDQLEAKAAQLAAGMVFGQGAAPAGATPPAAPPANDSAETADSLQRKALEAHEKFIRSGRKDKEAQAEEERCWAALRKLQAK